MAEDVADHLEIYDDDGGDSIELPEETRKRPALEVSISRKSFQSSPTLPNASFFGSAISRQPTTIGGDAKQLAYEQALTLMSHRCVSKSSGSNRFRQSSALSSDLLFGPRNMKMVFIEQKNPVPMPPLKAWKGYHGNVYFEPITIRRSRSSFIESGRRSTRNESRSQPSRISSTRQMAVLDKESVISKDNKEIGEDIMWIIGQESTGSLCVGKGSRLQGSHKYEKDKIVKGSCIRNLIELRKYVASKSDKLPPIDRNEIKSVI